MESFEATVEDSHHKEADETLIPNEHFSKMIVQEASTDRVMVTGQDRFLTNSGGELNMGAVKINPCDRLKWNYTKRYGFECPRIRAKLISIKKYRSIA